MSPSAFTGALPPSQPQVGAGAAQVGPFASQVGAGAAQPLFAQPLSQQEGLQLLHEKRRSSRPLRQTGSHLLHLWQADFSQPQLGALASQVGAAAAQVGALASQVGAGAAQPLFAQPFAQPLSQADLQQLLRWQQRFAPQGSHDFFAQQRGAVSQPQLGFAAQPAGAAQDGPAVQQLFAPLSQPQPLPPSIRSSRSNPKL